MGRLQGLAISSTSPHQFCAHNHACFTLSVTMQASNFRVGVSVHGPLYCISNNKYIVRSCCVKKKKNYRVAWITSTASGELELHSHALHYAVNLLGILIKVYDFLIMMKKCCLYNNDLPLHILDIRVSIETCRLKVRSYYAAIALRCCTAPYCTEIAILPHCGVARKLNSF